MTNVSFKYGLNFFLRRKFFLNIAWTIGVSLAYIATAKIGFQYAVIGESVTLMWPPSGIALAAILIGGYRAWLGIALGALLANTDANLPVLTLFIISLGNSLEALCGAALLRR